MACDAEFGLKHARTRTEDSCMKLITSLCAPGILALGLAGGLWAQSSSELFARGQARLEKEVRHELVLLPYYEVFDNLAYKVDGSMVTLLGQVTRPTLKSDAEKVVQRIEGVDRVDNQIEVLPLSPNDDRIRVAVYRAIYGTPGLDRYALRAVPSIHIIVKNGNVFLEGTAATEMDKNLAYVKSNGVSGVFSVTNNLRIER